MEQNKKSLKTLPDILDIQQMCDFLGISTKTGYKLLQENKIESIKVGRTYRIPKAKLLVYLKIEKKSSSSNTS